MERVDRRFAVVPTSLVVAVCALACSAFLVAAPGAIALTEDDELTRFGSMGTGAGQLELPGNPDTDPVTGHIFVPDFTNRVSEFTPWGAFVKAFGWDVAPGAVNEQQEIRIRAGAGQFDLTFEGSTTADLPFDATGAEVEAALNALSTVGGSGGSVSVTERPGLAEVGTPFIYVVAFKGALAGSNVAQIVAGDGTTPLSGGVPTTTAEVRTRANGTPGGTGLEACTTESGCQIGVAGPGAGQLRVSFSLAVGADGSIYVRELPSNENKRVQMFDSEGNFVLMFGGGVNQTAVAEREQQEANSEPVTVTPAEENLCTAASGDTCGPGRQGTGPGEFSTNANTPVDIAMGPTGDLFVADVSRIQRFSPEGEFKAAIPVPGVTVRRLTVDPVTGDFYAYLQANDPATPTIQNIHRLDGETGVEVDTLPVPIPESVSTDPSGNVFAVDREVFGGPSPHPDWVLEFDPAGEKTSTLGVPESGLRIRGLGTSTIGNLFVSTAFSGVESYIRVFGPAPVTFESAPKSPPEIADQFATSVSDESAGVRAEINPKFWPDTRFYVQYGTSPCFEGGCKEEPLPPGIQLTTSITDSPVPTSTVSLPGLDPGTRYYYRFVAQSTGGGPVFGITGKTGAEGEGTFKTRRAGPPATPDNRGYELVSPALKNSAEVGVDSPAGGGAIRLAAPSGEAITFASFTAFGDPESAPGTSQYVSRRTSNGWTTENINLFGFLNTFNRAPFLGFTEDLRFGAGVSFEPPLTPDAVEGYETLYWRDDVTDGLTAMNTEAPVVPAEDVFCVGFGGASEDGSRVAFMANGSFAGAPAGKGMSLYQWSASEGVDLVSVLPGEIPAAPHSETGFGAGKGGCNPTGVNLHNAISDDGQRIFWTFRGPGGPRLMARVEGNETVQLDLPQGGTGTAGGGQFAGATDDGSVVFFTNTRKLTPDAGGGTGGGDLFRYDFNQEPGSRLTDLTPGPAGADVLGVLGYAENGSYIYFVANRSLAPGAPTGNCGNRIGTCGLYVWHEGEGISYIDTLSIKDSYLWEENPQSRSAQVSPDGEHLAFSSVETLTGFNNRVQGAAGCEPKEGKPEKELQGDVRCPQVFLYDAVDGSLSCVSCASTGQRPAGPATLPSWTNSFEPPQALSDDGERLFFQSLSPLVPDDQNGTGQDVYEFERPGAGTCTSSSVSFNDDSNGCQFLVSSGSDSTASFLLDASSGGRDVFFATRAQLVRADKDERYDVYDFREGGGFPEPEEPAPCQGEGCKAPATPPPPASVPATPNFVGPGNSTVRRCPKGKVRKKGRCVKKHKSTKHKSRKSQQKRRSHR
jgi:hypothetical protein